MRKTRFALLVLLAAAIALAVGAYYTTQQRNRRLAPRKPTPIPGNLASISKNWSWSSSSEGRQMVVARAREYRQIKDSTRFELDGIELRIFSKTSDTLDLIRSEKAEFDQSSEKLYSEGDVTIVLGLPASAPPVPGKRYVEIQTSGLTYENKTGLSSTDRPVHFQLENGDGRSNGAVYDPARRYLWMKSAVEIVGAGKQAGMRLQAGELHYYEADQKVELRPWSRLLRGTQGIEAGASTIYLDKDKLRRVEAQQGKGFDIRPGREVRFSAAILDVEFTAERTVDKAVGTGEAAVVSQSVTGITRLNGDRVDLAFVAPPGASESELSTAYLRGRGRIENVPAAAKDRAQPETRILTANAIKVMMRPGGEEVQTLETLTPGRLEFIPNHPSQWKRVLTSERMLLQYAAGNQPERLQANSRVHLRSEPPAALAKAGLPPPPPRLTWSGDLQAFFDPQTGQMRHLEQWSGFRYQEGARKAESSAAKFDVQEDRVALSKPARVWDETSVIAADSVVLDQKQDRLRAEGHVTTTSQGAGETRGRAYTATRGQRPGAPEALFSSDRPIHATAERFDSEEHGQRLHYRGAARLWQEGNSVQAPEIDLDRTERTLEARGGVTSVLVEQQGQAAGRKGAGPALVSIGANTLLYTDQDRRAFYAGQVLLRRERMNIRAKQLEAFLRPPSETHPGESRLEHAIATGQVEILETAPKTGSPRRGSAEHAEYFSGEEKVILQGGNPTLVQPDRGSTRGSELTYYLDDGRLLVNGRPGARAETSSHARGAQRSVKTASTEPRP